MQLKKLLKPKIIVVFIAVVLIVWLGFRYFGGNNEASPETAIAKKGTIVQEVSVTGNTKPAASVDLAFEKAGRVVKVYAGVGEKVYAGQILAQLDSSELTTQLSKAQADLTTQESKLNESQIALTNYYDDVIDVLNDAYTKANDAVREKADDLFSDDERNPQLTFITSNSQNQTDLQFQRLLLRDKLNEWLNELGKLTLNPSTEALNAGLINATSRLTLVRNFLDLALDAVANAANISSATISAYKDDINTARTNVNTALANVNDQKQNIIAQKATIESQEATVKSYQAAIQNIQAQLNKTVLYSPIAGVVTKQDAKVGEIAAANSVLVSVISASKFEVEANIPEADIAKVKIGDPAEITLDAYGNDVIFDAKVVSIDPAETIIEGVATYKTKFQFVKNDDRPKSGMTANIVITTARHTNVIVVPQRAVTAKTNGKFVLVDAGNPQKPEEREVKTGLRGTDGNVEITDGLREGEKVIIPTLE